MDAGTAKDYIEDLTLEVKNYIEDLMLKVQAMEDSFRAINARMEQLKAQRDRYAERLFQLQTENRELRERLDD